jgi:glycosyltransferase involved in cell wall biosynthesis
MKKINTRLGVHYHLPIIIKNEKLYVQSYFGKWIDELCLSFKEVVLIVHTSKKNSNDDFFLKSSNIRIIDLGEKETFFLNRVIKFKYYHNIIQQNSDLIDIVCFRYPSPLTNILKIAFSNKKTFSLIVGNMWQLQFYQKISFYKNLILYFYWQIDHFIFSIVNRNSLNLSIYNAKKVFPLLSNVHFLHSSTIIKSDIVRKPKPFPKAVFTLIAVSRLQEDKGILSLIKAIEIVKKNDFNVQLNIVGEGNDDQTAKINELINSLNLQKQVTLLGKIKSNDILKKFDQADAHIVPALIDFSPRTTWEGAARGLPTIMSRGIDINYKHFNKNQKMLFFIANDHKEIADRVISIINDKALFKQLQLNSIEIAKDRTLEKSVERLVKFLRESDYI